MLRWARTIAGLTGIAVVFWQLGNAAVGRFVHPFLVSDLIVSAWLLVASVWPGNHGAAVGVLGGLGAMFGVFLSAVTGRMLVGAFDLGTAAAAVGLVPSLVGMVCAAGALRADRG